MTPLMIPIVVDEVPIHELLDDIGVDHSGVEIGIVNADHIRYCLQQDNGWTRIFFNQNPPEPTFIFHEGEEQHEMPQIGEMLYHSILTTLPAHELYDRIMTL